MFRLSLMWLPLALAVLGSGHVDHVNAASNDLMLDNVAIVTVDGTQTPGNGWSDSYSEGDRCYCDSSNYDHGIGTVIVSTPCGDLTVIEACDLIAATKPAGSSSANRPVYNDIQCGNGPPNNAGDEDMDKCPGRVDNGAAGCGYIGPTWNWNGVICPGSPVTSPTPSPVSPTPSPVSPTASPVASPTSPTPVPSFFYTWEDPTNGPTYTLTQGVDRVWEGVGPVSNVPTGYTEDMFKGHRSHTGGFTYTVTGFGPSTSNVLSLGFAEMYSPNCINGKRKIVVTVNGSPFVTDLDVYQEAGCKTAYVETGTVVASSQGEYVVAFTASVENPMVSTISIDPTNGPSPPTPAPIPDPTPAPIPDSTPAPIPEPTPAPIPDPTPAPVEPPTLAPVATPTANPPGVGAVSGFALVNAASNTDLRILTEGAVIDSSADGTSLNIRADVSTSGSSPIESVSFDFVGQTNFRTENVAPYALGGDSSGNYMVVSQLASAGSYSVTATPYSGNNRSGIEGTSVTINFTVI